MREYTFHSALMKDLPELVSLQNHVALHLASAEAFATDDMDFYKPIVTGEGHILLARDTQGLLAGASVIRYPSIDDQENLGHLVYSDAESLRRVRHLESIFIRENCRGKGLSRCLLKENIRATNVSERDILMATVWPCNLSSLKLHLKAGLAILAFAYKYDGKPRFILSSHRPELASVLEKKMVPASDMKMHEELLHSGWIGIDAVAEGIVYVSIQEKP